MSRLTFRPIEGPAPAFDACEWCYDDLTGDYFEIDMPGKSDMFWVHRKCAYEIEDAIGLALRRKIKTDRYVVERIRSCSTLDDQQHLE